MSRRRKGQKVKRLPAKERRLEKRRRDRQTKRSARAQEEDEPGRVVCILCGLEQPHRTDGVGMWGPTIAACEGPLGLPCASEHAITIERHLEEVTDAND